MGIFSFLFGKKKTDDALKEEQKPKPQEQVTSEQDDQSIVDNIVAQEQAEERFSTQEDNESVFAEQEQNLDEISDEIKDKGLHSSSIDSIADQVEAAEKKEQSCDSSTQEKSPNPQDSFTATKEKEAAPTVASEEVKAQPEQDKAPEPQPEPESEIEPELPLPSSRHLDLTKDSPLRATAQDTKQHEVQQVEAKPEIEVETKAETEVVKAKIEAEPEVKAEPEVEVEAKVEPEVEVKVEPTPEPEVEPAEVKAEVAPEPETVESEAKDEAAAAPEIKAEVEPASPAIEPEVEVEAEPEPVKPHFEAAPVLEQKKEAAPVVSSELKSVQPLERTEKIAPVQDSEDKSQILQSEPSSAKAIAKAKVKAEKEVKAEPLPDIGPAPEPVSELVPAKELPVKRSPIFPWSRVDKAVGAAETKDKLYTDDGAEHSAAGDLSRGPQAEPVAQPDSAPLSAVSAPKAPADEATSAPVAAIAPEEAAAPEAQAAPEKMEKEAEAKAEAETASENTAPDVATAAAPAPESLSEVKTTKGKRKKGKKAKAAAAASADAETYAPKEQGADTAATATTTTATPSEGETEAAAEQSTAPLEADAAAESAAAEPAATAAGADEALVEEKRSFFSRLKRSRDNFAQSLSALIRGRKIDDDLYDELETDLLTADLGGDTTYKVIDRLREESRLRDLSDASALRKKLKQILSEILDPCEEQLVLVDHKPFVILMVGVNGAGKTTTIGKLARKYQDQGYSVMLAAGDTFRAAAVEQLKEWGERAKVEVIAQATGADSASVLYDAVQAAKARDVDVLLCDTAGRLQNKDHLMDELRKIVRVMKKIDPQIPHEVLMVLDGTTGQNAVSQVRLFNEAVKVTGLAITKLDGTAKGGVVFSLADLFHIPIRYVGIGEKAEDLREFKVEPFVDALIGDKEL